MVLRRMFEENRPKEEGLEELKGIRAVFLGQLGQFGKESHKGFFISWPLYENLPALRGLIKPYPGKTTVNLNGEWQNKNVTVEVSAPVSRLQIQTGGEIDYPVMVDITMGEKQWSWYYLDPNLEESGFQSQNGDDVGDARNDFRQCLELSQLTEAIDRGEFRVVKE